MLPGATGKASGEELFHGLVGEKCSMINEGIVFNNCGFVSCRNIKICILA